MLDPHLPSARNLKSLSQRFGGFLVREIDVASLAFFRIAFGAVMFVEVWRFFASREIARYWILPDFHFSYPGFGWLHPWPGAGMYWHFAALGLLALLIAGGLFYRMSAALFFVGYTYVFLLEPARFQNHYYLICLISFLMVLAPAHRALSLDVMLRRVSPLSNVPAWPVFLLGAQVAVVYFFGGIAKINPDWFRGEPVRMWLGWRSDYPVIGPFLGSELAVWIWVYGGLLFDLAIVPLLLWRRSRAVAWVLLLLFHGLNLILFDIGIFPILGVLLMTILLPPSWPRRVLHPRLFEVPEPDLPAPQSSAGWQCRSGIAVAVVIPYLTLQILVPLRHFAYPGNVSWTEEGQLFAWQMKVRDKRGHLTMTAENRASGETMICPIGDWLPGWQRYGAISNPDLLVQLAKYAKNRVSSENGWEDVAIRAQVKVSLNGRPHFLIVHPQRDLAEINATLPPKRWILPMGWVEASSGDGSGG